VTAGKPKEKLQENITQQYRATIQRALPVEKHNYL
jgi:hypothetical protein